LSNFSLNLRTGFIISNYLLAGLALTCLTLSEIISVLTGGILIAGLIYCYALEYRATIPVAPPKKFPSSTWGLLLVISLYLGFGFSILNLVSGFLVYLLYTRFIFKTEFNDYLFGYLIAIVCLLIGALYVQDLAFGLVFLSFYLVLSWCLISYHLMAEQVSSRSPPKLFKNRGKNQKLNKALLGWSTGGVTLSFIMTAVIFITFPRLGLGFIALNTSSPRITGFSDVVTLGDVGKIKQNSSVVMRVEYTRNGQPYRPKSRILWRGVVLDHYNGKTWSSTLNNGFSLSNRPGHGLSLFKMSRHTEVVEQTVYMESLDIPYLFTHGIPVFVDGNFTRLNMDQGFVLKTDRAQSGPKKYTLVSEISDPNMTYNLELPHPDKTVFPERFLQLPEISTATKNLAANLTLSSDSAREKAFNILNHFSDFGYTLEMKNDPDKTALEYFLFDRKEGHCEYFASAMVILLREAGVPARLVNGFVGAEWHEWGNYLIVRQSHAHSWVEAYLPGVGWAVFDPTPPDPTQASAPQLNPLTRTLDLLRMNWQRYIVRYSVNDQVDMIRFFRSGGRDAMDSLKNLTSLEWKEWVANQRSVLLVLLVMVGCIFLLRKFRFSPPSSQAVLLYEELQKRLEKNGIKIKPHWTARELLHSGIPDQKFKQVERVIDYYEKVRFGNKPADTNIEKEIRAVLSSI
jgi:protein-glutamine gamma-glutamyltransferase